MTRTRRIRLCDGLSLPLDAVTQTFAILAVRGAGKSNAAALMVEGMFDAGLPFVVVDPDGGWWGLRSSADGKSPGLPIPIFGGRHGDVPLEATGGELIADLVVSERLCCVLDVSELSEGKKKRFLLDFAKRLYRKNEEPLHLFLEEADDYIPQKPRRDEAELLRAWENIVRRGRKRGLGLTLITQRSAVLNKNVLTQIETLLTLRTTAPQDRKAIEGWIQYQGQAREVLESLAGLGNGEAWVWSPSWLRRFERVQLPRRRTFDSGATPKLAKAARKVATLATIDLGSIESQMSATIERAKQDDPRELRAEVQRLRQELDRTDTLARREAEARTRGARDDARKEHERADLAMSALKKANETLKEIARHAQSSIVPEPTPIPNVPAERSDRRVERSTPVLPPTPAAMGSLQHPPPTQSNGKLAKGERKILTALAQHAEGLTKVQIAILAGYAHNGGGFNNYISALRSGGLIDGSGTMQITAGGRAALGPYDALPTGAALLEWWLDRLGKAEREALQVLVAVYPSELTKVEIAQRTPTGYEPNGGGFNNALSKLRTLELIVGRGSMRAAEQISGA